MRKLKPLREYDKRHKLKKGYVVEFMKTKKGDLLIPIPEDIIRAYHIEIGDVAVFEVIDKKKFVVKFIKNTMYSLVHNYEEAET